jgi:hypothetical protein
MSVVRLVWAWKSAINILGSFERAERHARVLSSVATYQVEMTDSGAYMHLHREGSRHLGMRISNEATIASIMAISREVSTKDFKPQAVYFKHPSPESIDDHESYFGCCVHFNSDCDALLVSSETLKTPNHLGDESIVNFFDSHLQTEISKLDSEPSLDRRASKQISQSLSEGVPAISDIASQFSMSGRTLQRRLSGIG